MKQFNISTFDIQCKIWEFIKRTIVDNYLRWRWLIPFSKLICTIRCSKLISFFDISTGDNRMNFQYRSVNFINSIIKNSHCTFAWKWFFTWCAFIWKNGILIRSFLVWKQAILTIGFLLLSIFSFVFHMLVQKAVQRLMFHRRLHVFGNSQLWTNRIDLLKIALKLMVIIIIRIRQNYQVIYLRWGHLDVE